MKFLTILCLLVFATLARANSYSTSFTNENPANWVQGKTNGTSWADVAFTPSFAHGTETGDLNYQDSVAALTGTWGQNQVAQLTVGNVGTLGAQFDEVEVHLNTTITSGKITGYEINCSVVASDPYIQIVKWTGSFGNFQGLDGRSATVCKKGDVLKAVRSGSTITAYKNGVAILSVNDSTYLGGSPGIGFYIQTVQNGFTGAVADSAFGASSFCATDSGTTCTIGPVASVSLSWQMPSGGMAMILRAQVGSSSQCVTVTNWTAITTLSGTTYSDTGVTIGNSYCYAVVYISDGLYAQASDLVGVDVTATSGPGVIFSAPPPVNPATNFNGSVVN